MSTAIKDWRSMPAGKEKMQVYLASREWAVLKEGVKDRSGGTCERCHGAPGTQTHHQTYERIYCERLDDLLHVCGPCHEFLSGKSDVDPFLSTTPVLCEREIYSVYLAGKITGDDWRDQIVSQYEAPGWSHENHSAIDFNLSDGKWQTIERCLPIPDGRRLNLKGPYWRPKLNLGGHGTTSDVLPPHASGVPFGHGESALDDRQGFTSQILDAIGGCSLVFAWIDSTDCYGTLVEIGIARGISFHRGRGYGDVAKSPIVAVFSPHHFDEAVCYEGGELWLSRAMADIDGTAESPADAWNMLWTDRCPTPFRPYRLPKW